MDSCPLLRGYQISHRLMSECFTPCIDIVQCLIGLTGTARTIAVRSSASAVELTDLRSPGEE